MQGKEIMLVDSNDVERQGFVRMALLKRNIKIKERYELVLMKGKLRLVVE